MNLVIINKIKELIKNTKKEDFFYFVPNESRTDLDYYRRDYYYEESESERVKRIELERARKKLISKIEREINKIENDLYEKYDLKDKIYIKNKELNFYNLQIKLTTDYLIISDTYRENKIFLSLNQGISIKGGRRLDLKNGEMSNVLEINIKEYESYNKDISIIYKEDAYIKLFKDIFEIIIINKDYY